MYWQEKNSTAPYKVPQDVQDVSFRLSGRTLPLDHAWDLQQGLIAAAPWLAEETDAAIHEIRVATSGNGWLRPENAANEVLHVSRRTRLNLRLPEHRFEDARALVGTTLDIAGHPITLGEINFKLLSPLGVVFCRYVATDRAGYEDESTFLQGTAEMLGEMGVPVYRMLPGKGQIIGTPDGPVYARSIMLADLEPPQSVLLQKKGVGPHRKLGCGIFMPHKGIDTLSEQQDDGK